MEKHVTIIGVLYIAFNSLGILAAIIVFVAIAGGGLLSGEPKAIAITTSVGSAIAFFLALVSVPGIIGGIGMLKRKSWARILVLILGFLNLLNIPVGTVVGIYTIWVLMKDETARLFASELRS
ncbi:hypothetical protein FJZ31_33750 [Candidatus Poribacteria bacterium]|nr:hypothetical protein [Candidatus Poribacteria bacterium]